MFRGTVSLGSRRWKVRGCASCSGGRLRWSVATVYVFLVLPKDYHPLREWDHQRLYSGYLSADTQRSAQVSAMDSSKVV